MAFRDHFTVMQLRSAPLFHFEIGDSNGRRLKKDNARSRIRVAAVRLDHEGGRHTPEFYCAGTKDSTWARFQTISECRAKWLDTTCGLKTRWASLQMAE